MNMNDIDRFPDCWQETSRMEAMEMVQNGCSKKSKVKEYPTRNIIGVSRFVIYPSEEI